MSCDSLSEVEERHGDPAQRLDAAPLLPLLLGPSGGRQRASVQHHRQLRLSGQLVDLHGETHPAGNMARGRGLVFFPTNKQIKVYLFKINFQRHRTRGHTPAEQEMLTFNILLNSGKLCTGVSDASVC